MKIKHTLTAVSVALLTIGGRAFAEDQPDDPWRYSITLPLQAPRIDGNVTVASIKENVNVDFDKLREHLQDAASLAFGVGKQQYGFFGDIGYMRFTGGGGPRSYELKFLIGDLGGYYRIAKVGEERPLILSVTGGGRFWYTDTSFSDSNIGLSGGKARNLEQPVIGLRATQVFTPKLHLDMMSDVGGFNIGYDTDSTWSAAGVLTYDFTKWFSLSGGYKAVNVDVMNGHDLGQNGINIIIHGPVVLLSFKF